MSTWVGSILITYVISFPYHAPPKGSASRHPAGRTGRPETYSVSHTTKQSNPHGNEPVRVRTDHASVKWIRTACRSNPDGSAFGFALRIGRYPQAPSDNPRITGTFPTRWTRDGLPGQRPLRDGVTRSQADRKAWTLRRVNEIGR